ncbi:uncharacterized protein B0H18DRAFT_1033069 [Fomitopsis serialis]|uniref:uncharacterized protein n=1 Tax=Fomitopsis serialis TaxID=139415 RepID=UPI0020073C55|nr:uncharacterized protein B0H18DRAFT_1033069 [Neoantrodia serialis]KAH9917972.1 hypothetical protein B0H18DRAFT_1033069 [Neoantrodia serialis]
MSSTLRILKQVTMLAITVLLLISHCSLAASTNRTIDDYYGDSVTGNKPIYTEGWQYGPTCSTCTITPSVDDLFDRSWHEATAFGNDPFPENVTISFNGTAVWVYCVVPNFLNHSTGAITTVNVTFELDGKKDGFYIHEADGTNNSFYYNVTAYSNISLEAGEHTIVMTPQGATGATYMGFDWAQYTTNESSGSPLIPQPNGSSSTTSMTSNPTGPGIPTPAPDRHSRVGAIIGGVIGGVIGVLAIVALAIGLLYRRRKQRRSPRVVIEPDGEGIQEAKTIAISPFTYSSSSQVGSSNDSGQVLNVVRPKTTGSPETDSLSPSAMSTSTAPLTSQNRKTETPSSVLRSASGSTEPPSPPPNSSRSFSMSPTSGFDRGSSPLGELSRQIREIEQTVADLRRRQSTDHRATTTLIASTQPNVIGSSLRGDEELRREIAALQVEVERLRAEQATLVQEAPPAYEPREEEEERDEQPSE